LSNVTGSTAKATVIALSVIACGGLSGTSAASTELEGEASVTAEIDDLTESIITPNTTVQPTDLAQSTNSRRPNINRRFRSSVFDPAGVIRIASGEGGFDAEIDGGDRFGRDHDRAGDINGDGVIDLVIGARSDDDGATDAGAAYILFMNADGTVGSHQKISALEGGFTDTLVEGNFFGYGVAGIGDFDEDGIPDVAVSAPNAANQAIYILHLRRNGTVKSMTKTSGINAQGLSAMGDLDGDGRIDLAAAEPNAADGGAIHILFFNRDSELKADETVTISSTEGGFGLGLSEGDQFGGRESAPLGDIDNDGTIEIAVGAFQSDGGTGAIWILSLDPLSFNVLSKRKIAPGLAGFNELVSTDENPNGTSGGQFGHAMAAVGDLNNDGVTDLITGANQNNEGYGYILYLNADKTVKTFTRINNLEGGFDLTLEADERFSRSISVINDDIQNGSITVNMGGGAGVSGSIYQLEFESCGFAQPRGDAFWSDGTTFFSNWSHEQQLVTGPLSLEQCALVAFENNAPNITHKESDGRCIVKDNDAILTVSTEGSTAYIRTCQQPE